MSLYKPAIGLEAHIQLNTRSKIFSSDATQFGMEPNTLISAVSLGYPGTLPVLNRAVLEKAVLLGLATNCEIAEKIAFDRKNYFYPDLPKGYQITQDRNPICRNGFFLFDVNGKEKKINILKIHLEEDAGKLLHDEDPEHSLIDFNRAGVPLVELVTGPDFSTPEEAQSFLSEIRRLVRFLGISDGHMEQGSLRCDANISINKPGEPLGVKVEIKNLNSFRFLKKALDVEIKRQTGLKDRGIEIVSETRKFVAKSGTTVSLREKETLHDYRYFHEPDLTRIIISDKWISSLKERGHESPALLSKQLEQHYKIDHNAARALTDSRPLYCYFKDLGEVLGDFKLSATWIMGPVSQYLNEHQMTIEQFPVSAEQLAALANLVRSGSTSFTNAAAHLFPVLVKQPEVNLHNLTKEMGLLIEQDQQSLKKIIRKIIKSYPEQVEAYKKGKKGLLGMFMGEIMKQSGGTANPKIVNEILRKELD